MIHQYQLGGFYFVLDIPSGSVHITDDVAYDMIALYPTLNHEALIAETLERHPEIVRGDAEEALGEIEALIDDGVLFSADTFADLELHAAEQEAVIKALCLHVAHTCNLTCDYCFAKGGTYHGESALMSFDVGKQALDFLVKNSGSRRNLEVDFFGGEPLMNWDVVKRLVGYARENEQAWKKNFRFTLTTNGLLIDDDVIEFSNREMDNVVLSLDGRQEVHDRLRKTVNGRGSYEIIVPKFQELVRRRGGKSYYIRGTFTHGNTDFTEDLFHMADLGFDQLSMEPVVCAPGDPYALTEADLPVLMEQYELLATEMARRERADSGFAFYHYMLDLEGGPCIYKRIKGCGAGSEYLAVTPSGDLYPCHQFVGNPDKRMGDVWQGVTNPALREEMAKCTVYSKPECRTCWARLYCSGGCAANAFHATGSVSGVYSYGCALFKKRMECAIMLHAARMDA